MLTGCGTTKEKNGEEKSNNISNNEQSNEAKQDEEITTNVAEFVKYKDATYFWKLSANSRENTGLFAKYSTNQNTKNELIKLDSSGNQTTVLTEKALGNICISNDKIFMQGTESESGSYNKIYSTDMNGENKKEYGIYGIAGISDADAVKTILGTPDQEYEKELCYRFDREFGLGLNINFSDDGMVEQLEYYYVQ